MSYPRAVRPLPNRWQVVLLAILIAWSGFSYAYHTERAPPDHDSPMQLAKEIADHSGKLEKNCDHCCHGSSGMLALCSENRAFALATDSAFASYVPIHFRTRASPPLTRPPQV